MPAPVSEEGEGTAFCAASRLATEFPHHHVIFMSVFFWLLFAFAPPWWLRTNRKSEAVFYAGGCGNFGRIRGSMSAERPDSGSAASGTMEANNPNLFDMKKIQSFLPLSHRQCDSTTKTRQGPGTSNKPPTSKNRASKTDWNL